MVFCCNRESKINKSTGSVQIEQQPGGKVVVSGALQLDTVASLHRSIDFSQLSARQVVVDLSDITLVDSAGLALCLEWISQAHANSVEINFENIPEQLQRLVKMNRLDDLFTVPESAQMS